MKVCKFIRKHSLLCLVILSIVCLLGCSLNLRDYFEEAVKYPNAILLEGIILQGTLALLSFGFIKVLGNNRLLGLKFENPIKDIYVIWPLALFAVVNIAGNFSTLKDIKVSFTSIILYVVTFLVTGIFEEFLGRGAAFTVFIKSFGNDKKGIIKAVIVSNIVFGFVSFSSLITGQGGFLMCSVKFINAVSMGILYAAILLRTGSIWIPVFLHVLFELTGSFSVLGINSKEALNEMIAADPVTMEMALQGIAVSIPFLLIGLFFLKGFKASN